MTVRLGIVGVGYISRFHVAAFQQLGAAVTRVADLNAAAAQEVAAKFGAAAHTAWQEIIGAADVDAVAIYASTPAHYAIAHAALTVGKHVLCEKTLTTEASQSLALARLAAEKNLLLYTSYMKRFFDATKQAIALLPRLGKIVSVYVRTLQGVAPNNFYTAELPAWVSKDGAGTSPIKRGSGGGILECGGSHLVDLLLHFAGMPSAVAATSFSRPETDIDLVTHALYFYADGKAAHLEANWHPLAKIGFQQVGWEEGIEIQGENGALILRTPEWNNFANDAPRLHYYDNATQTERDLPVALVDPFYEADKYFLARLAAGTPEAWYDREVGYRVDLVLEKTYEAANTRRVVEI